MRNCLRSHQCFPARTSVTVQLTLGCNFVMVSGQWAQICIQMQKRGKSFMLLVKGIHFFSIFSPVFWTQKYIPTCTHRMTDCYSHQGAFDSWTPGLHQEGSVKERCGFKEATLTWHNCSAPAWLEHLGGQKNKHG